MKLAMINVDRALATEGSGARMILTVHDELVFEVPEAEREATEALVEREMTGVTEMRVPLAVDASWGQTWADSKS
jgi:DNA polymerase-1